MAREVHDDPINHTEYASVEPAKESEKSAEENSSSSYEWISGEENYSEEEGDEEANKSEGGDTSLAAKENELLDDEN